MIARLIVQSIKLDEYPGKRGIVRTNVASCIDADNTLDHFVEIVLPEGHNVKPQDTITWKVRSVRVPFAGKVKFLGELEASAVPSLAVPALPRK